MYIADKNCQNVHQFTSEKKGISRQDIEIGYEICKLLSKYNNIKTIK